MIAAAGRSFTSFRMTLQNDRCGGEILHFVQDDTGRTSSGRTETGKIMQKVERKKHGERRHGRVVGVLLCALLLAGCVIAAVLLTRKAEEKPEPGRQPVSGAIVRRNREDLESITIKPRDGESWTAVRKEDGTLELVRAEDDEVWMVDETIADMLQDAAVNLTYEDVFTEHGEEWKPQADAFGLADPLITATFRYKDRTETTVRIGNSADPEENATYYMAVDGDDRLYAVASGTVKDLSTEKTLLHPVPELQIHAALLDRITVRNGDGSVRTEWKLNGAVSDQDAAENWILTAPFTYPADYDAMKNLKDSAEKLRLGTYIGPAAEESLTECGLKEPTAVLEMHLAKGSTGTVGAEGVYDVADWEERTKTLTLGKAKGEMVDYLLYEGKIYTISHFSVSTFTETEALSTAARYPVATPLNSLESVTVEAAGKEPVRYGLVRIDEEQQEDGTEKGEQNIRCLRNGEEIPYETFAAAYERMLTVTVSGKLPEGFVPQEAHTKYTFRTVSGGTHTVELCDFDGIHDAVKMDGYCMFYLIKDGMTELP